MGQNAISPDARYQPERIGGICHGAAESNLRRRPEGRFAGMSIADAVALGPEPWLDAGVSADVALRIFGERTALEAKLRTQDRSRASRRNAAAP
jgi:hypothetical protein